MNIDSIAFSIYVSESPPDRSYSCTVEPYG